MPSSAQETALQPEEPSQAEWDAVSPREPGPVLIEDMEGCVVSGCTTARTLYLEEQMAPKCSGHNLSV